MRAGLLRVSADLLDVVYTCQRRQAWYRDEALVSGEPPLHVVGWLDRAAFWRAWSSAGGLANCSIIGDIRNSRIANVRLRFTRWT